MINKDLINMMTHLLLQAYFWYQVPSKELADQTLIVIDTFLPFLPTYVEVLKGHTVFLYFRFWFNTNQWKLFITSDWKYLNRAFFKPENNFRCEINVLNFYLTKSYFRILIFKMCKFYNCPLKCYCELKLQE